MSCENTTARLQIKYSTITGASPSIPSTNDHNDGTWNPTDVYIGEFFLNATDNNLWIRTLDGNMPVSGGGSGSFIGDFVSKALGGTYSGPVWAPTFSANSMTAIVISATAIDATIFGSTGSVYYGDGSNLTGISTEWNGGTVSNASAFDNVVAFNQDISIGNVYSNSLGYIDIHSDITVGGGLSASYFVGDGSLLTNLPTGPTANDFTVSAYLDGSIVKFDRTDLADAYSVDLAPILSTQSISNFAWNSAGNEATVYINDGSMFTINISIFNDISANNINVNNVFGANFFGAFNGTFNGTFSNDIYTTSANLVGSTAVFDRTDGITYSLDLSLLPTGSASNLEQVLINGNYTGDNYILAKNAFGIANYNGVQKSKGLTFDNDAVIMYAGTGSFDDSGPLGFVSVLNMDGSISIQTQGSVEYNMNYFGNGSGTFIVSGYTGFKGIEYASDYSADYTNRSLVDKEYVDTHGGGATGLGGVLLNGNRTNGTDINLGATDVIISDDTKKTIGFEEPRILIQNEYSTSEYTYTGLLEVKNDVATSQLAHIRTDLTSGDIITTAVQIDETTATIISNNQTTYNEAFVRADSGSGTVPQAEVRLATSDFYGNSSYMIFNPGVIDIGGVNGDGFQGLRYAGDYSNEYDNRSLVDKEYVDGLVGGGATPSLSDILIAGNITGENDIVLSNNFITQISSSIVPDGSTGLQSAFSFEPDGGIWAPVIYSAGDLPGSAANYTNALFKPSEARILSRWSNGITGIGSRSTEADLYVENDRIELSTGSQAGASTLFTGIFITPSSIVVSGTPASFKGIEYFADYSTSFTARSLVDKEYVDNAVSGGTSSTPNLTQVLAVGATANAYIEFERTKGIREIGGTGSYLTFTATRTLWATGDGFLNSAGINLYKDGHVLIESSNGIDGCGFNIHDSGTFYSSGFSQDGIQYGADYSPSYTDRSLVDKGYIDTRLAGLTGSGGATPSLAQVLTTGNLASTDIDMNQNQIQNVSVIDADGNVGIHTINMINASLLTLMYNT